MSNLERTLIFAVTGTVARVQPSQQEWAELLPKLERISVADLPDVKAQRKFALAVCNVGRLDEAASTYERLLPVEEDPVLCSRLNNTLRFKGYLAGGGDEGRILSSHRRRPRAGAAVPQPRRPSVTPGTRRGSADNHRSRPGSRTERE